MNSLHASDIVPEDYHYIGLYKQDLFSAFFWTLWLNKKEAERFDIPLEHSDALVANGHFCFKQSTLTVLREILTLQRAKQSTLWFENLALRTRVVIDEVIGPLAVSIKEPFTIESFEKYIDDGRRIMHFWCLAALFAIVIDEEIHKQAQQEGIPEETLSALMIPVETLLTKQHREAWELKQKLAYEGLEKMLPHLKEHVTRYGWIEMANFLGEPFTVEKLLKQMEILSEPLHKPTSQLLSPEMSLLLNIAQNISFIRQYSAESFAQFSYLSKPALEHIAHRLNSNYEHILQFLPSELKDSFFRNSPLPCFQTIGGKRSYAVSQTNNEEIMLTDDVKSSEDIAQLFITRAREETNVLKGRVGNPGHAKGKVKVILSVEEFSKMEDNDVLVTTMTTPDFVMLMRRSCAIITDIGGLLSHAAIVGRELEKPCVIGTKFGTQILRDGDEVEVDATQGIITILQRAH